MEVLSGTLKRLDFETFANLDRDWARQTYFERTQPVFWIRTGDDIVRPAATDGVVEADDGLAHLRDDAMLIYNALLAITGQLYPDPRLSVEYLSGGGVSRRIGVFERTWLLNGGGFTPRTDEDLRAVASLAESWHKHGFRHNDLLFSPLRGLASLAATFADPALGMLPLIVSLEGFLIPVNVKGIARHMTAALKHVLGDTTPDDIEEFIRAVYSARSSLIHGRQIPGEETAGICDRLQQLTGAVVIAAAGEMMKRQLEPNTFDLLRKEWMPS